MKLRGAVALGLLSAVAGAQELLWTKVGVYDKLWLTGPCLALDDIDADGYEDLVLGVEGKVPLLQRISVIVSGRDGTTLRTDLLPSNSDRVHLSPAGDFDGDGIRDYLISYYEFGPPYGPDTVAVRSGRDGTFLRQITGSRDDAFGWEILGDVELDGDGKPDLVIAATTAYGGYGTIYAYDNAGVRLYELPRIFVWGRMGKLGDLDGDGCDEFIVGAQDPTLRGAAYVYSGKTGKLLVTGFGENPGNGFGMGVSLGCGDVNGDGVLDFGSSANGRGIASALVRVFSGSTGAPLYTFRNLAGTLYGRTLATGDLDRDGATDLLVGSGEFHPGAVASGAVYWYSLRTGALITKMWAPELPRGSSFGGAVDIGSPRGGNPFPTFSVVENRYGSGSGSLIALGRVSLYRSVAPGIGELGPACTGTLPRAPQMGLTDLGAGGVRLHVSGAPPGVPSLLLLGLSSTSWAGNALPLNLGPAGFPGCSLYTSIEAWAQQTTGTIGIAAGHASFDLPFPIARGAPTFRLNGQWLVLGPGACAPGALSGGLTWPH